MKNMTLWNIARVCHGRLLIPTGGKGAEGCPKKGMAVIRSASGQQVNCLTAGTC